MICPTKWSDEMISVLRSDYPDGGPKVVMEKLGLSYNTVTLKARRLGIPYKNRRRDAARTRSRTSTRVDQTFFETWTPASAYLLGYIWTDGCITTTPRHTIKLACVTDDEQLLVDIRFALKSAHPFYRTAPGLIRGKNCRGMTCLSIGSEKMVKDLIGHGLCQAKSKIDLPFPKVPNQYLREFALGCLDGDGCQSSHPLRYGVQYRAGYCGQPALMTGLRDLLVQKAGVRNAPVANPSNKTISTVIWTSIKDVEKLYKFFYDPLPPIFLRRKYNWFRKALGLE